MKKYIAIKFIIILAFLCGCARLDVSRENLSDLDKKLAWSIVNEFDSNWPEKFSLIDSVKFDYRGRSLSGIGYISANRKEKKFKIVVLNPLGMKLFEVIGDNTSSMSNFLIDEMANLGDIANAVSEDIRKVYFNSIPANSSIIKKLGNNLIFNQAINSGRIEYIFSLKDKVLIRKKCFENRRKLIWQVFYKNYYEKNGNIYPDTILINNYKYGYKLAIKLKEVKK